MSIDILINMANDIGAFFESECPGEQSARAIAEHLRRFWPPRMQRQIIEHLNAGGTGLSASVIAGVRRLAEFDRQAASGSE